MIKKILQREKFPTKLFIFISVTNLFVLLIFSVLLVSYLGDGTGNRQNLNKNLGTDEDRLFLKSNFNFGDDLSTNIPQLKDMLDGPIISKRDPIIGEFESPVAIVIYSDFECQFCQEQEKVLRKIVEEYPGQVQLIWKDYPVLNPDTYSWKAAKAGRCAQDQEKFWDYHDLLFESIDDQSDEKFLSLAQQLGLNMNKFEKCLKEHEKEELIMDNMVEAQALEIIGIPFIYINDQEIMGNITYEDLKDIVDSELEK